MNTLSFSPRLACSEDLEQILSIESKCYPEPWSADHFIQEMQKPYARVFVLTDDETDNAVAGYVVYWVQAEGTSLLNIAIDPKFRNLGFAFNLMQIMIKETVREEIPRIVLEVRESNQEAIHLYEKIGFKKTTERKKFYQNGETAWIMEIKTSDINTPIQ